MPSKLLPSAVFVASLLFFCSAVGAQQPRNEAPPDLPEVEGLLESTERLRSEYRALRAEEPKHDGEERTLIVLQKRKKAFEIMRTVDELVAHVVRQMEGGGKRPSGLKRTRRLLLEMDRTIPTYIDELEAEAADIRVALPEARAESREDLVLQLRGIDDVLDDAYPFFLEHFENRENLGLSAGSGRKELQRRASARASTLVGRVELLSARRGEARKAAKGAPDDAALQAAVRAADELLDDAASSLWAICDVMDALGLKTAEHRKVLIRATGEITGDVLDVEVVIGLFDDAVDAISRWLERRGPLLLSRVALFVAILALFWILGRVVRRFVSRLADRAENVSELSRRILVGAASRSVIALGFFVALSQAGRQRDGIADRSRDRRVHCRIRAPEYAGELRVGDRNDPLVPAVRRGRCSRGGRRLRQGRRHEPGLDDHTDVRQPDAGRSQQQDLGRA